MAAAVSAAAAAAVSAAAVAAGAVPGAAEVEAAGSMEAASSDAADGLQAAGGDAPSRVSSRNSREFGEGDSVDGMEDGVVPAKRSKSACLDEDELTRGSAQLSRGPCNGESGGIQPPSPVNPEGFTTPRPVMNPEGFNPQAEPSRSQSVGHRSQIELQSES